jgi:hypothetical protein
VHVNILLESLLKECYASLRDRETFKLCLLPVVIPVSLMGSTHKVRCMVFRLGLGLFFDRAASVFNPCGRIGF